jgi:glucosamine kinase
VYIARHEGQLHPVAGWGFHVSDLGSGARLGQLALQECLLAYDNIRPMTDLSRTVLAEFGDNPENVVDFARLAKPGDFGRYTPKVFECARQGDQAAIAILKTGAAGIDEALDAVNAITKGKGRLCLLGGLAPLYPEYLAERHRGRISQPLADALTGAVALAVQIYGVKAEARA